MGPFATSSVLAALSLGSSLVHARPGHVASTPLYKRQDTSSDGGNLQRDYETLIAFAKTVKTDPQGVIANWTASGTDPCSFEGVFCEVSPAGYNAVASVDFNGFQLGDDLQLAGFLDQLTDLALFHINTNDFSGGIPDLSNLPYLYELDFSNNHFSGAFPVDVLDLDLSFLDLRFNNFAGPLPDNLFSSWKNLEALFLNSNQFNGPLPEWTAGVNITYLSLANNGFTGPIPDSWCNNLGLQELLLINNTLSGTVPEGLCALPSLDVIDVSGNEDLTGDLGPNCAALYQSGVLVINGTGLQVPVA